MHTINAPLAAAVVSVDVSQGQTVSEGQLIATLESMKMQTAILAPTAGIISALTVALGETVQAGQRLATLTAGAGQETLAQTPAEILDTVDVNAKSPLAHIYQQHSNTLDHHRQEAVAKRHSKGYRSARENLQDLCDENSFVEYGQLAVAAQRGRKSLDALRSETAADGVITGLATINHSLFGPVASQVAVVINDYTVLAGTQGYFHHKKIDRILEQAKRHSLPVIMYTEGGGGRPGDTDVKTQIAGLDVSSFARWAALSGQVPLVAVNNGYCFAGNAALFGCADIRIATQQSWIGMAGPAMIEGEDLAAINPPILAQSTFRPKMAW